MMIDDTLQVTRLVLTCDGDVLDELLGGDAADAVCRGLTGLVVSDKSAVVQEAAALNVGKVFVHFREGGNSIAFVGPKNRPNIGLKTGAMCHLPV